MSDKPSLAGASTSQMVTRRRLLALRAVYGLIVVGQLFFIWPALFAQLPSPKHYHGVVMIMLAAFSILCAIGIRYPLKMLPVLLWEILWKLLWLSLIAVPRWMNGTLDPPTVATMIDCVPLILLIVVMPWRYVVANYVRAPAM